MDRIALAILVETTIAAHKDKAEQAALRPSLRHWFVGRVMALTNGAVPAEEVESLVWIAFQHAEDPYA